MFLPAVKAHHFGLLYHFSSLTQTQISSERPMVIHKTDPGSGFCLFMFMPISIAVPVRIHHCRRSRGEEIGPIPNGAPTCPCILARECGGFCGIVVTDNGDGECTGALGGLLDLSAEAEAEAEEGDIDRESCLE